MKRKIILIIVIIFVISILFIITCFHQKDESIIFQKKFIEISEKYVEEKYHFTPILKKVIEFDYFKTYVGDKFCSSAKIEFQDIHESRKFYVYADSQCLPIDIPKKINSYFFFDMSDDYQVPIIKEDIRKEFQKIFGIDSDFEVLLNPLYNGKYSYSAYDFNQIYHDNLENFDHRFAIKINHYDSLKNINLHDIHIDQENYFIFNYKNEELYEKYKNDFFEVEEYIYLKDMISNHQYIKLNLEEKDFISFHVNDSEENPGVYYNNIVLAEDKKENEIFKATITDNPVGHNNPYVYIKKSFLDTPN